MDNEKLDLLVSALEKRFAERKETQEKAAKEAEKEAKIAALEEKIAKLENTPVEKRAFGTVEVGAPDMYKGYNFKRQFEDNLNIAPKDPKVKEAMVKEALDVISRFKVLSVGGSTSGAELVPEQWVAGIQEIARLNSVALQDCRRFPMVNSKINIPKGGTSASVTWANENNASSQSEPGTAELELTAKRVGLWGVISEELLMDAQADVVGYISRDVAEVYGQEIDNQVFNGTQFAGIFDISSPKEVVFGASNNATSYKNLVAQNFYDARAKLPNVRRMGAKWYMPKEVFAVCAGLNTGTGGVPLVNYLGAEQSTMLAGYPVVEVEAISGTDATSSYFTAFCNLQNYALGVRMEPTGIELNRYAATEFKQFQVLYRFYARIIGAPLHSSLFVLMKTQ